MPLTGTPMNEETRKKILALLYQQSLVTKRSWSYVLASRKRLRPTWNALAEHDRMV
jgi:hypothetical protein